MMRNLGHMKPSLANWFARSGRLRAKDSRRRSAIDTFLLSLGKGVICGLAGTAAISISQMIEMKLSKRDPSSTPADAAGKVLGVQPRNSEGKERFATVVHWAYGTSWGLFRAVLGGRRMSRPWAPLAHMAAVQTAAMLMLPGLEVAPPVRQWGAGAIGKEVLHHTVYAAAADAAYRALS
jgi:hypothetical protein